VIDWGLELGEPVCTIRAINEAILGVCRRHPDRLTGFAGVDPRRADAVSLLAFAFDTLGASGLKLHPTSRGWTLDDDRVSGLVELAVQHKLPIMVHTGTTVKELSDENSQPAAMLGLAARFPAANFIAGHSGFLNWRAFGVNPPSNLWFDVSAWQEFRTHEGGTLKAELQGLLRQFSGRVFFGTDSPFYGFNMTFAEAKWIALVRECAERAGIKSAQSVFAGTVLRSPRRESSEASTTDH